MITSEVAGAAELEAGGVMVLGGGAGGADILEGGERAALEGGGGAAAVDDIGVLDGVAEDGAEVGGAIHFVQIVEMYVENTVEIDVVV